MEQRILKTKLHIPSLPKKLLHRPRLFGQHTSEQEYNVTLIVAPPGYGKTTLVCQGLRNNRTPVGWLTLDEDDNEITRFWLYFISAIQNARVNLGESAIKQLQSGNVLIKSIITDIINDISETNDKFIIVLDDFHRIKSNAIFSTLEYFINHMPPQIHIIIVSRTYPPLPLSRSRACGLIKKISVEELRFTTNETTSFFNDINEFGLSADDIAAVEDHIEGWIAGMQMLAVSMQGRKDITTFIDGLYRHGHNRFVMDYLIEEVLNKQTEDNMSFLLKTAILDSFTASLCNAVTGRDDAQEKLEQIESSNIFLIPLDDERKWYRYHHVFTELLRKQLPLYTRLKDDQQKKIAELHLRASNWFEQEGLTDEAIHHALIANDFDIASSLISKSAKNYVCSGKMSTLLKWIEKLPEESIYKLPELGIQYAVATHTKGKIKNAEKILNNVRKVILELPFSSENTNLLGELASILAIIAAQQCNITGSIKEANEAFALVPDSDLVSRSRANMALGLASEFNGDFKKSVQIYQKVVDLAHKGGHNFLVVNGYECLAESLIRQGRLTQAKKYYENIIELEEQYKARGFPPAGIGYIGLARISLEKNDIETTSQYIDKGIELCQTLGMSYYLIPAYYVAARFKLALGDKRGALNHLNELNKLNQMEYMYFTESPTITFRMGEYQTRIRLLFNDLETALYWAKSYPEFVSNKMPSKAIPTVLYETQQVLLAQVYSAMGDYEQAINICDQVNNAAVMRGHIEKVIQIGLIEAVATQEKGDLHKALNLLENVFSLAEPEGYIRIFIDAGEPMKRLLLEAESCGIRLKYVNRLLSSFVRTAYKTLDSPISVEQPSKREIEVLKLIESGMSNSMIAEKLIISESTIKTHINNLYRKLGVQSRTQAIYRAKELKLV